MEFGIKLNTGIKNNYPQVFYIMSMYFVKEKKISNYIFADIEISFDSYKENYGEENYDENN